MAFRSTAYTSEGQEYAIVLYWLTLRPGVWVTFDEINAALEFDQNYLWKIIDDLAGIDVIDVNVVVGENIYYRSKTVD